VYGINNSGQMAGTFRAGTVQSHGFITINGHYYQIDVPGLATDLGTSVFGINDLGQVVGNIAVNGLAGIFDLAFIATPCSGNDTNCVVLPEIGGSPARLVINCPEDIYIGCSTEAGLPVTYTVTATNEAGPPPIVVCSPPSGSLFPIGTTTVVCTASDERGNQTNCAFRIIRAPLQFTGFLDPLCGADTSGGSFSSPLRKVKLGSTLPVKFRAGCDGISVNQGVSSLSATRYFTPASHGTPLAGKAHGGQTNFFRLDGGEWHFNLDTSGTGMTAGTWLLTATLPDGSEHSAWIQIKK